MKKLLIFFLVLLFALPAFGEAKKAGSSIEFKDLKSTNPAYYYVEKMVSQYGVISGYPDNTFKGDKTITRAEFAKVIAGSISYIEKKYDLPMANEPTDKNLVFTDLPKTHWSYPYVEGLSTKYKIFQGYPDGSFKPNKTIDKYEMAAVAGRAFELILTRVELPVKSADSKFSDVKSSHWVKKYLDILAMYKIIDKTKNYDGKKGANRYFVASVGAKLIGSCVARIDALGTEKLNALRRKYSGMAEVSSQMEKQLMIGKPRASLSGFFGNIYEGGSGTNNWMNFGATASYGNKYYLGILKGDYEITAKVQRDQIVFLTSGGGITGGVVNEYRSDLDINTVAPVVAFHGTKGLILLGVKYAYFSNSISPMSFLAGNVGIATVIPFFQTNMLSRVYYSLLASTPTTSSALGASKSLLNYEAGFDMKLFGTPMLVGYQGETMFLSSGNFTRQYNMFFVSCSLM